MKIEIKVTDFSELTKENVLDKLDEPIKEYLKKSKYIRFKGCFGVTDNEVSDIFNVKNITNEQFDKLSSCIPKYYLSIDPGKDESWIDNPVIMDIIANFEIVHVNTIKMTKSNIERLISNIHESYAIHVPMIDLSNEFDYSHITMCVDHAHMLRENIFNLNDNT